MLGDILMVQLAGSAQQEKKLRREVRIVIAGELLGQEWVFVVFLKRLKVRKNYETRTVELACSYVDGKCDNVIVSKQFNDEDQADAFIQKVAETVEQLLI